MHMSVTYRNPVKVFFAYEYETYAACTDGTISERMRWSKK